MSVKIIIGTQWGDEGKGKIVDLLSNSSDLVVRFQGGANAGHTVSVAGKQYFLHMIPSGVLHEKTVSAIGNGVVFDYRSFLKELEMLKENNVKVDGRLFVSPYAPIVMPFHPEFDRAREAKRTKKIGTTAKGIGPAYQDKITRSALKVVDIYLDSFEEKLKKIVEIKQYEYKALFDSDAPFTYKEILTDLKESFEVIKPFVKDISIMIDNYIKEGKKILFEGAQGTLLDVDHGTFPFVTSSNTVSGGACPGSGVGPTKIDDVLGVVKAYTTRVGEGPFVTELTDEEGQKLGSVGGEFGVTTGRARRCGWLDLLILKYAARVNGLTELVITKIDVLDSFEKIKVCTGYEYKGEVLENFQPVAEILEECKPVYIEFDGWMTDTTKIEKYEDLPQKAKNYLDYISKETGVKISIVSVGPNREQSIFL